MPRISVMGWARRKELETVVRTADAFHRELEEVVLEGRPTLRSEDTASFVLKLFECVPVLVEFVEQPL